MTTGSFLELCYAEYISEQEEINHIYNRSGALITAIALTSAALFAVWPASLPSDIGGRFDESMHVLLATFGTLLLITAAVFVALALRPRPTMQLATMMHYRDWRESYRKQLLAMGYAHAYIDSTVDAYTNSAIEETLVQAHDKCKKDNLSRQMYFRRGFLLFFFALIVVVLTGIINIWVRTSNSSNSKELIDGRDTQYAPAPAALSAS
jgi:hypothetical protein